MQTVILAGGLGTRLRSVSKDISKVMMPVGGKPFLGYLLKLLKKNGVKNVILCVGYRANEIQDCFRNGEKYGLNLLYSIEDNPLGTAGAIKNMEKLAEDIFVVLNGDTFLSIDIKNIFNFHIEKKALVTIALKPVSNVERYGTVTIDNLGRVLKFSEKNEKSEKGLINAGIYVFNSEIFRYIQKDKNISLEYDIFPMLLREKKKIYGYSTDGYFIDIGIPQDYYRLQREYSVTLKNHE